MKNFMREDDGQAILIVALTILMLIFAVGLAIDVGQIYNGRRTAQEAADAAAFAGAIALYQNRSLNEARTEATNDAIKNGFNDNMPTNGTTLTINAPPVSGERTGDVNCVAVTIRTPVSTALAPQQSGLTTVTVHATGCATPNSRAYAVMALDQACADGTASISSNGDLVVHNGSIMVNSCSSRAAQDSGSVTLDTGYETDVVGNVQGVWPSLHTGYSIQGDPFAGVPKPLTNGLTNYGTPQCAPLVNLPGIYTGAASNNCEYIFAPGTFIFAGGALQLGGAHAAACTGPTCSVPTADGGVFFFFTNSTYPSTSGSCNSQPVKIEGGVNSVLMAPTSGTYKGMLIWQDNVCQQTLDFGGGGGVSTTGSIYAPNATVEGNGTNSAVNLSQVIAKHVNTQNADFTITYSADLTYQPIIPALVE